MQHVLHVVTAFFVYAQMQHIVQDEVCLKITGLHQEERKNGATGGRVATVHQRSAKEGAYQKRAEQCLSEENCFRVVIVSTTTLQLL